MSSHYRTSVTEEQEREEISQHLTQQLETFLQPLLTWLDAYLDRRLVRTFLLSLAAIVTFRHHKQGLYLSELGSYLLQAVHAPAGTKRLSRLLHCEKWGKALIERFLWEHAQNNVEQMEQAGEEVLCIWDGSVIEKPESERTEGLCAVRSSKARRLKKQRKGNWNPQGGKAITVLGIEWTALLVLGMKYLPTVATMQWWSRKGENATSQREVEKQVLLQVASRWGRRVLHVFDRGYASKGWIALLSLFHLRFVIRWKKGHVFFDQKGQEKKLWEIARGKRSWQQREVWDERKKCWCKMGVLALPLRHAGYGGALWMVIGRRKGEPWYLITNECIEIAEQAWHIIFVYARRWQIELTFRYGKSELAMESPRMRKAEEREKLLLMVTLVYAYLLSLIDPMREKIKIWLLRHYCHRTGKRCQQAKLPLYRLRWALSRFWQQYPPVFTSTLLKNHPEDSNRRSESSG
jgi:transposase